nr:putative ribonuclease H-like domain-containing protein [Tanacetum cinerariifolium]
MLEAYSDSDYTGANKDRKSTTGGCQFLGRSLISWQCKKQTIVATSSTEAEYVAAANCCGQKLIQVLKIHIDDNVVDLLTKTFDGPSENVLTGNTSVPADVPTSVAPAGVSNKGKTSMVEEDITVKERTFKQMKDDRLREQAAKRLHDEEQAQVDRQRAELQRRRQQEVLASAIYYTEADWINIMAQIQKALSNIQIQAFSRTLKRIGLVLEEPSSKRKKSTEAPIPSAPEVPQSPIVSSPKSFGIRRKSLCTNRLTKPKSKLKELDLDADDQTFIKVVSNENSEDEAPLLWSSLVGWEVITTPLGDINALYRIDWSTAHFTTLRKILHNSMNSLDSSPSNRPTIVKVPKEIPKVSMVNTSLKKLKHHLAGFDVVVKERTMAIAITEEIFQQDNSVSNQSALSFDHYFELNELKTQSQEKDTVISKLKERIKSLSGQMKEVKNKMELEEIETINIELDHRVSKLVAENEHLNQTYKQLYDSIKSTRIQSKEQCDDLINQVNLKSVEIFDLNASLQENVLVIIALKDALRKLKRKALADDAVISYSIAPEMLNIDVEPLNPRLLNNRSAHSDYLKHTQEEAAIFREIVKQGKSKNPLNAYLDYACKYIKQIQVLLIIIGQTCPNFNNSRKKLVAVTPKNKDKRVRFTEPVSPSGNTIINNASSSNLVSNKPALSSTGVKSSTRASGSQPSGNTKKDKIQQLPSSTQKNKIEAHPRIVKTSLKNKNHTVEPKGTTSVQHSKLNVNSEL